jgi:transcriptional regulator with XRE-family HTH domain
MYEFKKGADQTKKRLLAFIKSKISERRLSQKSISQAIGVSETSLSRVFKEGNTNISIDLLIALLNLLNIDFVLNDDNIHLSDINDASIVSSGALIFPSFSVSEKSMNASSFAYFSSFCDILQRYCSSSMSIYLFLQQCVKEGVPCSSYNLDSIEYLFDAINLPISVTFRYSQGIFVSLAEILFVNMSCSVYNNIYKIFERQVVDKDVWFVATERAIFPVSTYRVDDSSFNGVLQSIDFLSKRQISLRLEEVKFIATPLFFSQFKP